MDEELKPVAEHVGRTLANSEARLYATVDTNFRWVLATLFAANGGALVALLSRDSLASTTPLAFFAGGVVASILMGVGQSIYGTKALLALTDVQMTFVAFVADQASFEDYQTKMAALEEFKLEKWGMYLAGFASFALLIGGMMAFACTYVKT